MGRMRIAVPIAMAMMDAVGRDPMERASGRGHAAKDHQGPLDRREGGERMVREQAVEPDIDAEPGRQCQHQERDDGVYRQSVEESYRHRYCGAGEWGELDGQAVLRGVMRPPQGVSPRAKDYGTQYSSLDVPVGCIATKNGASCPVMGWPGRAPAPASKRSWPRGHQSRRSTPCLR